MSDYIPTTADVRDAYSSESSDSTYANRMFDAWLARYKAKIVAKTEERIIKLLEKKQGFCHEISRGKKCDHEQCKWFPYIIELINGETK